MSYTLYSWASTCCRSWLYFPDWNLAMLVAPYVTFCHRIPPGENTVTQQYDPDVQLVSDVCGKKGHKVQFTMHKMIWACKCADKVRSSKTYQNQIVLSQWEVSERYIGKTVGATSYLYSFTFHFRFLMREVMQFLHLTKYLILRWKRIHCPAKGSYLSDYSVKRPTKSYLSKCPQTTRQEIGKSIIPAMNR